MSTGASQLFALSAPCDFFSSLLEVRAVEGDVGPPPGHHEHHVVWVRLLLALLDADQDLSAGHRLIIKQDLQQVSKFYNSQAHVPTNLFEVFIKQSVVRLT